MSHELLWQKSPEQMKASWIWGGGQGRLPGRSKVPTGSQENLHYLIGYAPQICEVGAFIPILRMGKLSLKKKDLPKKFLPLGELQNRGWETLF